MKSNEFTCPRCGQIIKIAVLGELIVVSEGGERMAYKEEVKGKRNEMPTL